MAIGTVKFFNTDRGYGFISNEEGGKDAFVHITEVERAGMTTLKEGQRRLKQRKKRLLDAFPEIASLLKDFLPQAQQEPGVREFQIHQNMAEPRKFFFYEVFAGDAAFAEHQQTAHFKNIIVGQAIPKLAKRERSQFRFI